MNNQAQGKLVLRINMYVFYIINIVKQIYSRVTNMSMYFGQNQKKYLGSGTEPDSFWFVSTEDPV